MDPEIPGGRRDDARPGVAVAIVVDNEDPEGLGRVKLTYPWRETDDESHWARVATPMAGEGMGAYFLPEVDDEVLVGFDDGDVDHPYVIGALWNGEQPPPVDNADGDNDVRVIRSRSGHELVLDDDGAGGKVAITTSGGHSVVLDDDGETITVEDGSGANRIEFDAAGRSLTVKSGGTLSIEAQSIEIAGGGNVTISASGILTLEGSLININ